MPELRRVDRGDGFEAWEIDLHGHQVVYRIAGSGPPVVLVHGMVNSSRHWRPVAMRLAERHTVIAPDLDRPRRLGDAARRLLARRARDGHPRPAVRARDGPRDDRRALARRRRRDGLLLAVPAPGRAARAGLERRPRARGLAAAALDRPAGRLRADLARGRRPGHGRARPRGRRAARARLGAGRPAAGDRPRAAAARRAGRARGVRAHAARGDRRARPARRRLRPPVPARGRADADRLGRARPHDPDRARPRRPRRGPAQPLRDAARRGALPAHRGAGGARGDAARLDRADRAGDARRGGLARPAAPARPRARARGAA